MQDLFHSTTYWLKACGIFKKFLDNYMEAEPYIPLPKKNVNQPLVFEQLMMLWLIWVSGLTAAVFSFFGELTAGSIAKNPKKITRTRQRKDDVIHPVTQKPSMPPVDMEKKYGKRRETQSEITALE